MAELLRSNDYQRDTTRRHQHGAVAETLTHLVRHSKPIIISCGCHPRNVAHLCTVWHHVRPAARADPNSLDVSVTSHVTRPKQTDLHDVFQGLDTISRGSARLLLQFGSTQDTNKYHARGNPNLL
ncbi:hypothetical protein BaRGS_00017813 [Batillaria attramentaria]|uniref:Uncharacterized protein n=1 Tax=Batillaria attramentaria TaxID=370345 RepID=A0ABD0KVA8_9CAEN